LIHKFITKSRFLELIVSGLVSQPLVLFIDKFQPLTVSESGFQVRILVPELVSLFLHISCFLPCVCQVHFKSPDSLCVSEATIVSCYLGLFSLVQNRDSLHLLLLVPRFNVTSGGVKLYFHPALLLSHALSDLILHLPTTQLLIVAEPGVLLVESALHPLFERLFSLGAL